MSRVWALVRDQRGGISVLLAGSLMMLAGAASMAVDMGSIYLARRQLQGVADAAALAATHGGRPAADALLMRSGIADVRLLALEDGHYLRDPSVEPAGRFLPGDPRAGASRLEVERRVPLFFAKLLTGRDGIDIRARATAARWDMAAFSIGTGLARMEGGLPNALLSALAGTELNLSVMDAQGLASLNVDLLGVADALRLRTGRDGEPYGALFDTPVPIAELVGALADGAAHSPVSATLRGLALRLPNRTVRLSDIIDLGPIRSAANRDQQPELLLDAFTVLRMVLSPPSRTAVPLNLNLNVPGLTSTRLMLVTGTGQATTPLLTITAARDMVVRTAQTRLYLETQVATAVSGLLNVRMPLYVELAAAEARLSAIDCASASAGRGVALSVTPSVGSASIADIDEGALTDFATAANPRPATLVQTIGTRISGHAVIALGGTQAQSVHFTPAQIAAREAKTVATQDVTQGVAASLARKTELQVSLLGLNIGTSPLVPVVGAVLGTTAPLIDNLVNSVTELVGVRIGTAQVRVHQMRCGIATIVA